MAARISRRKIADYVADQLVAGKALKPVITDVAAFLIETRRTRETELIVRDIEQALADRGLVVADVTTAFPLTEALKQDITALVGKKKLFLRETVDPSVLGGMRLSIPGKRLDATLQRKIQALKA